MHFFALTKRQNKTRRKKKNNRKQGLQHVQMPPMNYGGLTGHSGVALWSSSVKVLCTFTCGEKKHGVLILLSSMITLLVVDVSHWFS